MFYGPQEEIERLAQGGRLWLFLDYDGTLADFAPTPDDILPDPELIELLTRLRRRPTMRAAVVSGRRLAHVRALLPVAGLPLAGTYGIEYLLEDGERVDRLDYAAIRPTLERIKPGWAALIEGRQGYYLEDKGWTLAIHARYADEQDASQRLARARWVAAGEAAADVFRILGGDKFLEVGPRMADKGQAVDYLLERYPWEGALPVFLGDDDKDERGFAAVKGRGGVGILVSKTPRETQAALRLEGPESVRQWLRDLVKSATDAAEQREA